MKLRRVGCPRPRLDQEHEFGAVFPAINDRRGVLGLWGNVADLRGNLLPASVALHADCLPDFYRTEDSLRNKKPDLNIGRWQQCYHRRAGRHPFALHVERVGDLTVAWGARGFLLESPVGLCESFPRGGSRRLRRADLVGTCGELRSGELSFQLTYSSAVAVARRTRRFGGFVGDKFRAYELFLSGQIAFGTSEARFSLCELGPNGV